MARVFVGNLGRHVTERDLEDDFKVYGPLRRVWVARKPPGYAFIDFNDRRDANDAIRKMDGKNGWRVELSHNSRDGGGGGGRSCSRAQDHAVGSNLECYRCGEVGHFARECRSRFGAGGSGNGRRRSRSPRYRPSPSYDRSPRDRSPKRRLTGSPRDRSSRRRTYSSRENSHNGLPPPPPLLPHEKSPPYANGLQARFKLELVKHGRAEADLLPWVTSLPGSQATPDRLGRVGDIAGNPSHQIVWGAGW